MKKQTKQFIDMALTSDETVSGEHKKLVMEAVNLEEVQEGRTTDQVTMMMEVTLIHWAVRIVLMKKVYQKMVA